MVPPEDLTDPGIEPESPALRADFLLYELPGKPKPIYLYFHIKHILGPSSAPVPPVLIILKPFPTAVSQPGMPPLPPHQPSPSPHQPPRPPQGGRACWAWTIMPRSQRRGKVGHGGGRSAPGWPVAAVRPGSPPLQGVFQPWLQSSPDPFPGDSSRAFAQGLGGTLTGEGLQAQ